MKVINIKNLTVAMLLISVLSCSKDNEKEEEGIPQKNEVPAVYSKIYGATSITSDGTFITIKTNGTPDSKSVYYPTSSDLYENFSGTTFGGFTFKKNPNTIASFDYTLKSP